MNTYGSKQDRRMRIGIVGAGAAGLTAAWLLDDDHTVTLFEKQTRLGGHADTVQVERDGKVITVDAGFEFFSERMYPNFYRLLGLLQVPVQKFPLTATFYTTTRGAVTLLPPFRNGQLIWSACTPRALAEMVQLARVLSRASSLMSTGDTSITLKQFLDSVPFSRSLTTQFIYPFLLAGWCVEPDEFKHFIAYNILRYIFLHKPSRLRPVQWLEVVGGTIAYIKAMAQDLVRTRLMLAANITSITRLDSEFMVRLADDSMHRFDQLVMATNASEARALLARLDGAEAAREVLSRVEYFRTSVAVHGDRRLMPAHEEHWSVANIRYDGRYSQNTIWKPWKSKQPVFRSWITYESLQPEPLYATATYDHPKVTRAYFDAQPRLGALQGNDGLWFAGMYTRDVDSHESAVSSAIHVARQLAPQSARLQQLLGAQADAHAPLNLRR